LLLLQFLPLTREQSTGVQLFESLLLVLELLMQPSNSHLCPLEQVLAQLQQTLANR
jgi:hypothetical protein